MSDTPTQPPGPADDAALEYARKLRTEGCDDGPISYGARLKYICKVSGQMRAVRVKR